MAEKMTLEQFAEMIGKGFAATVQKGDVEQLRSEMQTGFEAVDKGFKAVDEDLEEVFRRLERIEKRILEAHEGRLMRLEDDMKQVREVMKL